MPSGNNREFLGVKEKGDKLWGGWPGAVSIARATEFELAQFSQEPGVGVLLSNFLK
jgi:hypothetical protein